MDDIHINIDNYNPKRNSKILIVFDNIIADINTNKTIQAIFKALFIRCRKMYMCLVFITQSYFLFPKKIRLNSTHYLIMKIHNNRELQSIAINNSSHIDYTDFLKIYRKCTNKPFFIDTTLPAQDPSRCKKNLLDLLKN